MQPGDNVLIYHSNARPAGIAGLARVTRQAVVDPDQFDPASKYFDEKSKPEDPTWFCVEIKYVKHFKRMVSLDELKKNSLLKNMLVIHRGMRLSVQPVLQQEFDIICAAGGVAG